MSDSIRQQLGQIQGTLTEIQKSTDKIPDLLAHMQRHDAAIRDMQPHVADYVRTRQRAVGIGAFIALVFAALGRLTGGTDMLAIFLPRGIRNNNPGNIRRTKTIWQGQVTEGTTDADFAEFLTPVHGLRALMKTLLTYHFKHGLDTVQSILNRYAPPHENATDTYIHVVARHLGVKRTDKLNLKDRGTLTQLAAAIVRHENGKPPPGRPPQWYDPALYAQAADTLLT